MPANLLGERFVVSTFGESHGKCIGALINGCPAGLKISESDIQSLLDLRKPGQSIITTQRKESDVANIISGVFNGYTTGAPICIVIWNSDADSRTYEDIKFTPRPGHSDYTAFIKYGGFNDYRGSGRFSGRLTAALVMGGAIAIKILKQYLKINIISYTQSIGNITFDSSTMNLDEISANRYTNDVRCPDYDVSIRMKDAITNAKKDGDSLGGIIESIVYGVPVGLGEPIFESIESEIARGIFSIPAVKGIEFGSGFGGSKLKGSENNDPFVVDKKTGSIKTSSNNSGGILGGITDGMPITFRTAFKPAASISKIQNTIDLKEMTRKNIQVKGRHDPCVVPRAPPVIDSIVAIILLDQCIKNYLVPNVLRGM